jgi:hypothetical protein
MAASAWATRSIADLALGTLADFVAKITSVDNHRRPLLGASTADLHPWLATARR